MQAIDLSKSWGNQELFHKFNYTFDDDETYQLCGENGSGKTTLLKTLCGLVSPDEGNVDLRNKKVTWCSSTGIGFFPRLTGLENISMMASFLKSPYEYEKWLSFYSFEKALSTPYGQCSDGMKMLLSLFVSSLGNVDILVWDEVFKPLSKDNRTYLSHHWQELSGAKTLIFTSHEKIEGLNVKEIELKK